MMEYFNSTLGNKLQWNLNRNSFIFIQENAFENVVWKMTAILSRPQCVNTGLHIVMSFALVKTIGGQITSLLFYSSIGKARKSFHLPNILEKLTPYLWLQKMKLNHDSFSTDGSIVDRYSLILFRYLGVINNAAWLPRNNGLRWWR